MKVLVIGASGAFGSAICEALCERNHEVTALARKMQRPANLPDLHIRRGDALDGKAVMAAMEGQDAVVFAMNAPYHRWARVMPAACRNVAAAASAYGTTLLFPGNVYHLPTGPTPLSEDAAPAPPTAKGELRLAMERRLNRAAAEGARTIILRMGDFFGGPGCREWWFREIVRHALEGGAITLPSMGKACHQWAYLPDAARAAVLLLERRQELENSTCFHFSGDGQADNRRLVAAIETALGRSGIRTKSFPWPVIKAIGLFVPLLRELAAMQYLWDETLLLNDVKLRRFLGASFAPPRFEDAIAAPLTAMASQKERP